MENQTKIAKEVYQKLYPTGRHLESFMEPKRFVSYHQIKILMNFLKNQ